MKETVLCIAPSSIRLIANYALSYVQLEREHTKSDSTRFLDRIEGIAKRMLLDTSKRRLKLSKP